MVKLNIIIKDTSDPMYLTKTKKIDLDKLNLEDFQNFLNYIKKKTIEGTPFKIMLHSLKNCHKIDEDQYCIEELTISEVWE